MRLGSCLQTLHTAPVAMNVVCFCPVLEFTPITHWFYTQILFTVEIVALSIGANRIYRSLWTYDRATYQ